MNKYETNFSHYLKWPPFRIVKEGLGALEQGNDEVGVDPKLSLFVNNLGFGAESLWMNL